MLVCFFLISEGIKIPELHTSFLVKLLECSSAETEKGIFDEILKGDIDFESHPWPSISNSAKDLVEKMLIQDPKKRITSAQVLGNERPLVSLTH